MKMMEIQAQGQIDTAQLQMKGQIEQQKLHFEAELEQQKFEHQKQLDLLEMHRKTEEHKHNLVIKTADHLAKVSSDQDNAQQATKAKAEHEKIVKLLTASANPPTPKGMRIVRHESGPHRGLVSHSEPIP